jgi:hypothetical protein
MSRYSFEGTVERPQANPSRDAAEKIQALKNKTYGRYYFIKTGMVLSEANSGLSSISDVTEIDESVTAIRIVEVEQTASSGIDERSDTPIIFGSQSEFDNLLFEIKV